MANIICSLICNSLIDMHPAASIEKKTNQVKSPHPVSLSEIIEYLPFSYEPSNSSPEAK